jgi:hypothetical protein
LEAENAALRKSIGSAEDHADLWEARNRELRSENAALRADAERYRHLVTHGNGVFIASGATKESVDAAIDAARKP